MASRIRQQPGLACEECRRRKARCDRVRPQCSTCAESGTACIVVDQRPQRGPKKGQLKALRNRVATLERQLSGQVETVEPEIHVALNTPDFLGPGSPGQNMLYEMQHGIIGHNMGYPNIAPTIESIPDDEFPEMANIPTIPIYSELTPPNYQFCDSVPSPSIVTANKPFTPSPTLSLGELGISEMAQAELDQLYFDHVHAIAPIMHKRRYFSWAGQEQLKPGRECLRSAMRTMAAAVSSTFCSLSEPLYVETRRMLDVLDVLEPVTIQLEQIQAGLLLAHYELMRMHEHQAMLTAGRTFRLVQMSRLCDIDGDLSTSSPDMLDDSFADAEERRRTFWLAFTLDRFLSTRNEWPLTLHEEMIYTRLPAPETNFQNSQPIQTDFLPEAVANSGRSTLSPFAECIVLAALYGRCMAQRRLAHAVVVSGTDSRTVWTRVEWLAAKLEKRTQRLVQTSPVALSLVERDPMLAFTHMLAHSAIIHLYQTTQATTLPLGEYPYRMTAMDYEQRAYLAASYTGRLARGVPQLSCFKVHPFLPNVLSSAATLLMARARVSGLATPPAEESNEVDQLLAALRSLRDVNILAHDRLCKLEACGQSLSILSCTQIADF